MKKCPSCGALQKDSRSTCIDCGTRLGAPMNCEAEKRENEILTEALETMAGENEEEDVFAVTKRSLKRVLLTVLSVVIAIVLLPMISEKQEILQEFMHAQAQKMETDFSTIYVVSSDNPYQPRLNRLDKAVYAAIYAIGIGIPTALDALFPKFGWYIDSWRHRIWFRGEPEPSAFYIDFLKITRFLMTAITVGCSAAAVLLYLFS